MIRPRHEGAGTLPVRAEDVPATQPSPPSSPFQDSALHIESVAHAVGPGNVVSVEIESDAAPDRLAEHRAVLDGRVAGHPARSARSGPITRSSGTATAAPAIAAASPSSHGEGAGRPASAGPAAPPESAAS